jgi:hypothetical protein
VAGPTPSRDISENVARAMEKMLGLPDGYLDHEEDPAPPVEVQAPLVADIVHIVLDIVNDAPQRPSASKIAEVVALAYEQAAATGNKVDREFVKRLLKLVT